MPHAKDHVLADVHQGGLAGSRAGDRCGQPAPGRLVATPWQDRAAVFLRAAELLAGPWRDRINAATMLGQSKTVHQAEIDAACELCDFWRFNVSVRGPHPVGAAALRARCLESPGLPAAGRLCLRGHAVQLHVHRRQPARRAPALMGNTVVWKPASTRPLFSLLIMRLLQEAGLPDGVINLVYGIRTRRSASRRSATRISQASTSRARRRSFRACGRPLGANIAVVSQLSAPRGETGGKDFIVAHPSADIGALATAIIRGAFEYQGQKCSAASRLYVPSSLWRKLRSDWSRKSPRSAWVPPPISGTSCVR